MDNYCTKCGRRNDGEPAARRPGVVEVIYGIMPLGPIGWALFIAGLVGYAGSR
jgi:hypothetical protein